VQEVQVRIPVEGGVHPIEFGVKPAKAKYWWIKTASKLSLAVKVL
jgi:hypothetical protein